MNEENKEQTITDEKNISEGADDTAENVKEVAEESEEGKEDKENIDGDEPSKETSENKEEENPDDKDKESDEEDKEDKLKDVDPKNVGKDEVSDVLKDKGFSYPELQKEYNETGNISKETREKLAKVGITNEMVDNYIEGQQARVDKEINEIAECVGGREQLNEIIQWAAKNLTDEEKIAINNIDNAYVMKVYLKDLQNRMEEKEGKVPETTLNGDGGKATIEIFESQAQMFEAIRDPKYKVDEAYRAKVMKKIQASREAGIDLGI